MEKHNYKQAGVFKKVYIATGNKSKLEDFRKIFGWVDAGIEVEQVPDYVEVEEGGETVAENSLKKVLVYKDKYGYPVIANDSGMLFDDKVKEVLDPVKVKRNALGGRREQDLSQEEMGKLMFEYYKNLAKKYGGKIDTVWHDVFTILYPDGNYKQTELNRKYWLTDRECEDYDIYHPLNSLRKSQLTGAYIDSSTEEDDEIEREPLVSAVRELINR